MAQRGLAASAVCLKGRVFRRVSAETFPNGEFYVCKMMYRSVWSEPMGAGWATDYPYAGINLMTRIAGAHQDAGEPRRKRLSELLGGSPHRRRAFPVSVSDWIRCRDGGIFSRRGPAAEDYLLKGGFLWVDDFWGTHAWRRVVSGDSQGPA